MSDFLSREADILGSEFSTSMHRPTGSDDIDFDRAASAFPDIDIDSGDFMQSSQPPPPIVAAQTSNGFSFDNFGSPPPSQKTEVKVTGDDDFDTFESEFPEIEISAGQVSMHSFFLELGCQQLWLAILVLPLSYTMILHAQDENFTDTNHPASFSTAATTRLRRYIRPSTTSVYIFFDSHLDPKYIRGRTPGHQVRITIA